MTTAIEKIRVPNNKDLTVLPEIKVPSARQVLSQNLNRR